MPTRTINPPLSGVELRVAEDGDLLARGDGVAAMRRVSMMLCLLVGAGLLGSASARASSTLTVTGPPEVIGAIAPPAGSPIDDIARDCGNSVRLSNCDSLWVFCDSYQFDSSAWFFLSNTAALGEPDTPTIMREPVNASPRPFALIPGGGFSVACDPGLRRVLWPWGVAAVPLGDGRDRMIVYFSHSCSDDAGTRVGHGVGVADWIHDPANPPSEANPIQASVLVEQLWSPGTEAFGWSPVFHDGHVLSYRCPGGQACRLARVAPGLVGELAAYEYFDGAAWSSDPAAAGAIPMPGTKPNAGPGITFVPELGSWLMVYPLPWSFARFLLRVADEPWGPWSDPQQVTVPGCTRCYAARPHASLSSRGIAGFSVYDPSFTADHGSLKAVRVPVSVAPDTPGVDLVRPTRDGFTASSTITPAAWALRRGTIPMRGGLASRMPSLDDERILESATALLSDQESPPAGFAFYYLAEGLDECGRVLTSR